MSEQDWKPVLKTLVGSWPSQVASWGNTAAAAYIDELRARGMTPGDAIQATRSCPATQKFPPSAPELAGMGRQDVSVPTFSEFRAMIYSPGGVITAGRRGVDDLRRRQRLEKGSTWLDDGQRKRTFDQAAQAHADRLHPLVGEFVARYGLSRLQNLEIDDPEYGPIRVRDLEREWSEHVEVSGHRDAAHIASGGRRGEISKFDPVSHLQSQAPALEQGEEAA